MKVNYDRFSVTLTCDVFPASSKAVRTVLTGVVEKDPQHARGPAENERLANKTYQWERSKRRRWRVGGGGGGA